MKEDREILIGCWLNNKKTKSLNFDSLRVSKGNWIKLTFIFFLSFTKKANKLALRIMFSLKRILRNRWYYVTICTRKRISEPVSNSGLSSVCSPWALVRLLGRYPSCVYWARIASMILSDSRTGLQSEISFF